MNPLNLVIELSDLLESTGYEGGPMALLFDEEIFPAIRQLREKADPIGLGDRFGKVIDKVQASLNTHGTDRVRTLKDMMKSALITYVRATHDAVTARNMYHRAIMSGSDTMLTVTAATILANALSGQHQDEAKMLIQQVSSRLSGKQPRVPSMESASGAAVGSGAIAVAAKGMKKKRRRNSIFAEAEVVPFNQFKKPVENPALGQADQSNVTQFDPNRPRTPKPQQAQAPARDGQQYHVVLYTPRSGEEEFVTDMDEILDLAQGYGIKDFDRTLSMWYSAEGATLHIAHPDRTPLSPVEGARMTHLIQRHIGSGVISDNVNWDDLIGKSPTLDILREISEQRESRSHDGVMVDPVTAELVLNVHQSLTKPNQRRYESKSITEMIKIAHRAVERGLIEVVMQEA